MEAVLVQWWQIVAYLNRPIGRTSQREVMSAIGIFNEIMIISNNNND